jgi:superfamily II DNA helicase RecQ
MQYKFFTFPMAPSLEQEEELNRFLRSHRVLSVDKELLSPPDSCWIFVVRFMKGKADTEKSSFAASKVNYQEILSQEAYLRYEKMRVIRKSIAQELNIPAYAVFTNKELSIIAGLEKCTAESLLKIEGIGAGKMEKVGYRFINALENNHEKTVGGGSSN